MLYTMTLISTGVYVNKIIVFGPLLTTAASVSFPITFIIADVVTEVYGYNAAKNMIWNGLFCQFLFAIMSVLIVHIPTPKTWHYNSDYVYVLGNLIYVYFCALVSAPIGDFTNIYVLSKLKTLYKGRYFWVRSTCASAVGKLAYTIICISLIYYKQLGHSDLMRMIVGTYLISIVYIMVLATPASFFSLILKRIEKIGDLDFFVNYNPFTLNSSKHASNK